MTNVWMKDAYGNKAHVPSDERDAWVPRGWTEADEPAADERVWMEHGAHGGRALFPAGIAETWQALGWAPSPPPEPVDVTKDPALVDVVAPTSETPPAKPAAKTKTEPATPGRDKKE